MCVCMFQVRASIDWWLRNFLKWFKDCNTFSISHTLGILHSVLGSSCCVFLLVGCIGNTNNHVCMNVMILFSVSPEPKTEMKTLKWAISQFASVERIVGEDKYFCENCHHYTEAERSLLFDKMPEVITIHLKCFAASGIEWVCWFATLWNSAVEREILSGEMKMP